MSLSRKEVIQELIRCISPPSSWKCPRVSGSPGQVDAEYGSRIQNAFESLHDVSFQDNMQRVHGTLLSHGLVPLSDTRDRTNSRQSQMGRALVNLIEKGGVYIETESVKMNIDKSELMFWFAAHFFNIEVILFSSRKHPHQYKPFGQPRYSVAFLQLKDRYQSASQTLLLVRSHTRPSFRTIKPPPPPNPLPQPKYLQAVRRMEVRKVLCNRFDHDRDVDAFHWACIEKVREETHTTVKNVIQKRDYNKKQPGDKHTAQKQAYVALRTKYLGTVTLPSNILDKAIRYMGESMTAARKKAIEPKDAKVRLSRWQDIVKSDIFYRSWTNAWKTESHDPVIDDPFPHHLAMYDYSHLLTLGPAIESGSNQQHPVNDEDESKCLRTCSATFNNLIRGEHRESRDDARIIRTIEATQLTMTSMLHEVYTIAHMATLLIAQGGADTNGPVLNAGFDLKLLVPQEFRSTEDAFQWQIHVAPITGQNAIEIGASSHDDRFKLLGQENLKFWFTRLLSPGGGTTAATDRHPLWASLLQDIKASEYQFQQIPPGLTHTAQLHIQQAATGIGNLWTSDIYSKSFKHLSMNALRLRLAPNRFRRGQAKGGKQTATCIEQDEGKENSVKMPRSQWSRLVSGCLDELATVCRREDFSDDKTHSRVQGIMMSLGRLKRHEYQKPDEPSFIPKLSVRHAMAVAKVQQEQQQHHLHDVDGAVVASDGNIGGVDQMLLDADLEAIDDDDDDWELDEEYENLVADEFDSRHCSSEEETEQDSNDSELLDQEEPSVETSGKQIRRLSTVVKILVHSPHITRPVRNKDVQDALLTNMEASNKELSVVREIVNWLRPFAPKRVRTEKGYRDHTGHVVLCAPMVLIAQAFFDAVGLHKFKRNICPHEKVGSTTSLQLSPIVLYELFGTGGADQFDIRGSNGGIITSASDAANPCNKEAIVAAFFNLEGIQRLCNEYNLVFDNRFIFQDRLTIRIQGKLIPHGPQREGYPVESAYERRKEKCHGRNPSSWIWSQELQHWSSLSKEEISKAAKDSALIANNKENDLKAHKASQLDPAMINKEEHEVAQAKRIAYYWSKLEKESKSKQVVKAPVPTMVTWDKHHIEEEPSRIRLKSLVEEAEQDPKKMVSWAGGDPGVRVMLEVVPSSTLEIKTHLSRFHALYDLDDTQRTSDAMDIDIPTTSNSSSDETALPLSTPPKRTDSLDDVQLEKATRVSARHLQEVSFTRAYMTTREKRLGPGKRKKSRNRKNRKDRRWNRAETEDTTMEEVDNHHEGAQTPKTARDYLDVISMPANTPKAARSVQDIARISSLRREAFKPIHTVQSSACLVRLKHTQEIHKKKAKTAAAARLKKAIEAHSLARRPSLPVSHINANNGYCRRCHLHHPPILQVGKKSTRLSYQVHCPKTKPQSVTVFAHGAAGSGVGSRIGGNLRWGGKWMRQELQRLGVVVALTDEYCTTKTCVHCLQRLKLQKSRRLIGTNIKLRTVHGSMVCTNPLCPAVRAGYATRPRDTNASVGILLSAASVMLKEIQDDSPPWPIGPYSRYIRPRELPTIDTGDCIPDQFENSPEQMGPGPPEPSAILATVGRTEN
ncbi:hypothetical protein B0O80DRAFT_448080 [Mortierella sp. GBAus27b]|nr:hypothetical protein B0O80DRAFT_448080 [Mortierella sp. GBAus27b]